uniref:Uncharacterized protein n=1 Tax=Poecilia latipinna TaxID=48699 RepID=A0A3B3VEU7_9TELE
MCTTMMVLTTIAIILRQRFSNKIKPGWGGSIYLRDIMYMSVHRQNDNADMKMPYMKSNGTTETPQ